MRLARAEDPAEAGSSIMLDRHRLIKADDPSSGKEGRDGGVPHHNHLADLQGQIDK